TSGRTIFVLGNVGVSTSTIGDYVGVSLAAYEDLKAPGGLESLSAVPDPLLQPPVSSAEVLITPLVVPPVSVSTGMAPVIMTLAGPGIPEAAVGYPAYALVDAACNNGKDPAFVRNNMCKDALGNYLPDQTRWICADGTPWPAACAGDPPLLDVNGDGVPDNFSAGSDPRLNKVSLTGDSVPAVDLVGSKVMEIDLNRDGIPDQVFITAGGDRQMMLGTDLLEPAELVPASDRVFVPSAWTGSGQTLKAMLPTINAVEGYYEVAAGRFYDDPASLSGSWRSAGVQASGFKGMRASAFAPLAAGDPVTAAVITGLALPVPNITRLAAAVAPTDTEIKVVDSSALQLPGLIYVGSEIMRLSRKQGEPNTLLVTPSESDNGRGLRGSAPIAHMGSALSGEPVSDGAAIFSARFVSVSGSTLTASAVRPMFVFRYDPNAPTVPGEPKPQVASGAAAQTTYEVKWDPSEQRVSGVAGYEIQERGGPPDDLQANVVWRPLGFVPGIAPSYFVGSPAFPGESPRPRDQFFFYRARAMSNAGVFSSWSVLNTPVATGAAGEILSNVRNYPNPVDTRKSGPEGKTAITYMLESEAEVTITVYDLLGYVVREFSFAPGSEGGKPGFNSVTWDGKNALGGFVSKGGYIVRVKASSSRGNKTILRKVGVIH
ncbi:MAG TPA: FlgD immunoglobulin-like domain containing protein, partial [Elusimicrobiales bacterium]|nr:FlgD immunoglobulin-like domain containing protein [Elusimicrobiales bacterium]